jgi:hypothetical protein
MAIVGRVLFLPRAPGNCDATYRALCEPARERNAVIRAHCETLWADFADLADPDFVQRFPFEFHQRWFEMYLGAALRRAGCDVSAPKPGPDFQLRDGDRRIFIEAIAPTAGNPEHADAVPESVYRDERGVPIAVRVPHNQITLRLAQAFRAKADSFDRYRVRGLVTVDDACVIAINLRDVPHAWADAEEFWFRAVYGMGNRFVGIDPAGGPAVHGREFRNQLRRAGGAIEDVAPLLNDDHARISGVLGSSANAGNEPRPSGDDFVLMPHAEPSSPYPKGFLAVGREIFLRSNEGDDAGWAVETIDHGAHAPRGPERLRIEFYGAPYECEWSVAGRNLSVRVGSRVCDVPLSGGDDPELSARAIAVEMLRSQHHNGRG